LFRDRLAEIEPDAIAQQEQRDPHVRDLGGDARARLGTPRVRVRVVALHPAVLGDELARLRRQQHRQVLRS
jgi:hypothetical protein